MVVKWNFSKWVIDERIRVAVRVWVVGRVLGGLFVRVCMLTFHCRKWVGDSVCSLLASYTIECFVGFLCSYFGQGQV